MWNAAVLTLALGSPPSTISAPPPDTFVEQLDHVESSEADEGVEIIAYNDRNIVIGVVVMTYEPRGVLRLASDYDDGFSDVTMRGRVRESMRSSLPDGVAEHRANAMFDAIQTPGSGPLEGWGMCAAKTLVAVGACNSATWLITCGPGAFLAACECIPLVVPEDWPRDEC